MKRVLFTILSTTVFVFSCDDDNPSKEVGLSDIQSEIFDPNCATLGCHVGSTPPRGLNLEEGNTFSNIVNVSSDAQPMVLLVSPGNPDESYLFLKITGEPSITGNPMPLGRSPLSDEEIEQVREWILAGAQDN